MSDLRGPTPRFSGGAVAQEGAEKGKNLPQSMNGAGSTACKSFIIIVFHNNREH